MSNRLGPVFSVIAGVVFAGAAGYYLYKHDQFSFPGSQAVKEMVENGIGGSEEPGDGSQQLANVDPQAADDAGESGTTETDNSLPTPGFDVLRVEKDGSTVIAGTAPANSEIEVVNAADGNKVVGSATSLPSGDYAIVLEEPLAPGKHELYIVSKMPDGSKVQSADAGLIEVPADGSDDEPTVLVMTPDAPTRVLQAPDTEIAALEPEKTQEAEAASEGSDAASDTQAGSTQETASDQNQATQETAIQENAQNEESSTGEQVTTSEEAPANTETASEESANTETASDAQTSTSGDGQTEAQEQIARLTDGDSTDQSTSVETVETEAKSDVRPVLIQAADVEAGKIYIAGQGEPGAKINMYFGDKLIGSTSVAENGAFLFEGDLVVEPGTHAIRADMVNNDNTAVLARAEVRLVHQPEVDIAKVEAQEAEATETETSAAAEEQAATGTETAAAEAGAASDASSEQAEAEVNAETEEVASATNTETQTSENNATTSAEAGSTTSGSQGSAASEEVAANETQEQENAPAPALSSDDFNNRVEGNPETVEAEEAEVATAGSSEPSTEQDGVQEIRTGTSVIIRRGDNLWRIARRNYGQGIRYTTIFKANRDQIKDPDLIYPGQVFDIPENADSTGGNTSG